MFKCMGIIAGKKSEKLIKNIEQDNWLRHLLDRLTAYSIDYRIDDRLSVLGLEQANHYLASFEEMKEICDVLIVAGGDGTILSVAKYFIDADIPIIGLNKGRLGFLTEVSIHEIDNTLMLLSKGLFHIERHFVLKVSIYNENHELIQEELALNEMVLHSSQILKMIDCELTIDDYFVSHYRCDGLIVSTPTGSTAYTLSAGGSIIHPSVNAISVIPLSPHMLSSRSLIVPDEVSIQLSLMSTNLSDVAISCDGNEAIELSKQSYVLIQKYCYAFSLLRTEKRNFFERCRKKLNWGLSDR